MERGLEVVEVSPKGTSSRCPRCGSELVSNGYKLLKCGKCGFTGDRDVIATVNLYKSLLSRHSRCGA